MNLKVLLHYLYKYMFKSTHMCTHKYYLCYFNLKQHVSPDAAAREEGLHQQQILLRSEREDSRTTILERSGSAQLLTPLLEQQIARGVRTVLTRQYRR